MMIVGKEGNGCETVNYTCTDVAQLPLQSLKSYCDVLQLGRHMYIMLSFETFFMVDDFNLLYILHYILLCHALMLEL
jgi:hypothetical protein